MRLLSKKMELLSRFTMRDKVWMGLIERCTGKTIEEKGMTKRIIQTKARSRVELIDEYGISNRKIGGNANIHPIFL
jgi:hypothetical protein